MPSQIHLNSRAWAVGQIVQTVDNINPNSNGFDFRMSWGDWPTGPCLRVRVELATDGVTFRPWIDHTFNGGTGTNIDGSPRTSVGVSGTWPGVNSGDPQGSRQAVKGTDVRFILDVLQPFTASLDVVTT